MFRTGWWKARGVHAGAAAATTLALAGLGVAAMTATTAGATKVVTRDGFRCTKASNGIHHVLVGRSGQVVCALAGNDTLIAKGPGHIVLIAGSGHDTLVASSSRHGHDILIGGSGTDQFKGGKGWDNMWGGTKSNVFSGGTGNDQVFNGGPTQNTFNCDENSNVRVIVVKDNTATGSQDDDCQGADVSSATLEFEGTVTATDGTTTMTISPSDENDAAQAYLTGLGNPKTVTFDITHAQIERDGGGKIQVGDGVEVASNLNGTALVAVSVQAGSGGDDNQGDDNQGDNCQGNEDNQDTAGVTGPTGPSGPSGACGPSGATGPSGASGDE